MHTHIQHIPHLSALLAGLGLREAVLSPGSRCAPLVLAMVRQKEINCYSIIDERSAAFIALGMSIASGKATALVCTSGTAGLNYSPAVAEAFYQEVPLLILTADRPPEWIDQWDGQTIRQEGMYGRHVKASFSLPEDGHIEQSRQILLQAWQEAHAYPCGPVHVNVPIREPFYLDAEEEWPIIAPNSPPLPPAYMQEEVPEEAWQAIREARRILILAGQQTMSEELHALLAQLQDFPQITLVHDIISNGQDLAQAVLSQDLFLGPLPQEQKQALQADVLLSTGKSLISKNLKLWLRAFAPKKHWHVDTRQRTPDPFRSLSGTLQQKPETFFKALLAQLDPQDSPYRQQWLGHEQHTRQRLESYSQAAAWSEWKAIYQALHVLPKDSVLHLANSMAVRYVNFFGHLLQGKGIRVQANRGTSGIDGSNGTALGYSLLDGRIQTLITGDLAFLYDANAFWHKYPSPHLRIIVLNNGGGGIFRMIEGPARLPELEDWFETRHSRRAKELADNYGFRYLQAEDLSSLEAGLQQLYLPSDRAVVLEIFSNPVVNTSVLQSFKNHLYP